MSHPIIKQLVLLSLLVPSIFATTVNDAYADPAIIAPPITLYQEMSVTPTISYDNNSLSQHLAKAKDSYSSTLTFSVKRHTGITRKYSGNTVGISMTASSSGSGSACDNYFSVELHRAHWPFNDYVGSAGFKRDGYSSAEWNNVGPGDYYFVFVKCDDTKTITSGNVRMYSY